MSARSIIYLTVSSLLVSACGGAGRTPPRVDIPVPVACPRANITPAGDRPNLPLQNITNETPVDVAARLYKASLLEWIGYTGRVEIERNGLRDAYDTCTRIPSGVGLQPSAPEGAGRPTQ